MEGGCTNKFCWHAVDLWFPSPRWAAHPTIRVVVFGPSCPICESIEGRKCCVWDSPVEFLLKVLRGLFGMMQKPRKRRKSLPHIYSPLQTFPVILNTNVTQKCALWKGLNNRPCAGSTEECVVKPVQWLQDLLPKHENFIRKKTFFHTWNATGCELGLQISQFNVQINWGKNWLFKPVWAQIHLPCTFEPVSALIHQNTWRVHSLAVSSSTQCQVPNFESF